MRYLKLYLSILIIFLIQTTILEYVQIANAVPTLLLVFGLCFAVCNAPSIAMFLGVAVCGVLCDVASGSAVGINGVLFLIYAIPCTLVGEKFFRGKVLVSMVACFTFSLINEIINFARAYFQNMDVLFSKMLTEIILPTAIYNVVLCVLAYLFVSHFLTEDVAQ